MNGFQFRAFLTILIFLVAGLASAQDSGKTRTIANVRVGLLAELSLRKLSYQTNPIQVFIPASGENSTNATFVLCIPIFEIQYGTEYFPAGKALIWSVDFALQFIDKLVANENSFDVHLIFLEDDNIGNNINEDFDEETFLNDVNYENKTRLLFDDFDTYQNLIMVYADFSKPPIQVAAVKSKNASWNTPGIFIAPFLKLCRAFKVSVVFSPPVNEGAKFLSDWDYDFPLLMLHGRANRNIFNAGAVLQSADMAALFFQYAQNAAAVFNNINDNNNDEPGEIDRNLQQIEFAGTIFFSERIAVLFLLFFASAIFFITLFVPSVISSKKF